MIRAGLALVIALNAGGAAGVSAAPSSPSLPHEGSRSVWVVQHGWHARVAVARVDVDPSIWPESRDLVDVQYLEVGWGDRDFYPKPEPSVWDAIDPVIRATPAALHVGGFDLPPARFLPDATIVRLRVSPEGFARLTRFIHEHYVLEGGAPVRIRPGYYPRSWFYLANGRYHVLRNSNNWAARALLAAGVPVTPWRALTAGCLIGQVEDLGDPVGR